MSIYLDNAATTYPKPESVYQAVDQAMRSIGASPGRGGYRRAMEATRVVFEAREAAAAFFGVADSSRVIFTQSATESLNLAVSGLLRPGDHAITSTMEHNSLARPLHRAQQQGAQISRIGASRQGLIDPAAVAAAITPNTRLIAFAHCSNVTGTIQPLAEIAAIGRSAGIPLLLDAAQSAGTLPIDVGADGIDLLAAPGHKGLFGPQGTGILCIAPHLDLAPLLVGGTGSASSGPDQPTELPERFESGTHNLSGIAGLRAGLEFITSQGIAAIRRHEAQLTQQLLEGLAVLPGVTLHGPPSSVPRAPVVSFNLANRDPSEVGYLLDSRYDIQVRVGLHCAPAAHTTIGTYPAGTVRVSPGYFNTGEDISRFLAAMGEIAAA
jgi:cysteine desulfurase family protein